MVVRGQEGKPPNDRSCAPTTAPLPPTIRESFYGATLDASGDGYAALRAVREGGTVIDWVLVDANELVRDRWRWVVGDVIGVRLSVLDAAADNSRFHDLYCAALGTGHRQEEDLELSLPGGKGGWRRVVVVPVDDDTITVITRNVTREHYFESALERTRHAFQAIATGPERRATTNGVPDSEVRLLSRSASFLFFGAGTIAVANSYLASLHGANIQALRLTGLLSMLAAFGVPLLPWSWNRRFVASGLVVAAVSFVVLSDQLNHFSHTQSAVAVYPVFFIMVVAWAGFIQIRGAASIAALLSGLALGGMLIAGGHQSISWECVLVSMSAAAVLGEVLAWSHKRASHLAGLEVNRRLHDPLTGLANRLLFIERMDQALARLRRNKEPLAVLFVDLDRFKHVNDSFGHAAGDQLLLEAAGRLRAAVRENDDVARFGGDEFAVLCQDIEDIGATIQIARRVLDAFAAPFVCNKRELFVTASVGIAFASSGYETAEVILQNADAAMYRAKDGGRARFEVFDDSMQHMIATRLELESALRQVVSRDELRVLYQPLLANDAHTIIGFEALVRWERPGFGLLGPGEFIAVAEETGIIIDIGAWILNEACRQAAAWATLWPERRLGVAVNISSRQVLKGDILQAVHAALEESGLDPPLLTLELTETTLIDDAPNAQAILRELRELGVSIALDDFGTGYSSLTYLRTFPIDIIKIDGSFIRTLRVEREALAIVSAVTSLAKTLNIKVTAEGIEDPSQLEAVVELGCDFLQGYLFSRPKEASELRTLLESADGLEKMP